MHILTLITAALILLTPVTGIAQAQEPLVTAENKIEAARKQMRFQRKLVLAGELHLTPNESEAFWPIYNEYTAEITEIGDKKVSMITAYAENFDNITPEYADQMLKDYFDNEQQLLKLRKKYVKHFKKALPSVKVAKLYQIENKLNAVVDMELAAAIPVIGTGANQGN